MGIHLRDSSEYVYKKCEKDHRLCKGKDYCNAKKGFSCTREKGHTGPHVACGTGESHNFEIWED